MKRSRTENIIYVFIIVLLFIFAFITFYPFYYVTIYSLSAPDDAAVGVYLYPKGFTLQSYTKIFAKNNIGHAAFVSITRTVVGTFISLFVTTMLAYSVSKTNMPFRKFVYTACVIVMYFTAGLIPWYLTMKAYGLRNNFWAYILPGAAAPFNMILVKTYFEQIPKDIEESAYVDGAGYFRILIRIVLPISLPILATISTFTAVGQWNSWMDNLFLCPDERLRTLQFLLYQVLKESTKVIDVTNLNDVEGLTNKITPNSIRMAITVITVLPICFVYPIFQRYFMSGLMVGAIKG